MADFINVMKQIAGGVNAESSPSNVLFGTVVNINPLEIQVEQKLRLSKEFLILTKNVIDYKAEVTINWKTESVNQNMNHTHGVDVTGEANVSIENYSKDLSHAHNITGKKEIMVHNALKTGDIVILIQQAGGQKYVVLDKVY